jgi:transposase-like protein
MFNKPPKPQGQHFLHSAAVRDISTFKISQLTSLEIIETLIKLRWGSEENCVCPSCGSISKPYIRVKRSQLRCRHCQRDFSPLQGTIFQDRKISLKKILFAMTLFVEAEKGVAAVHLARMLDVTVKTAFVLMHKLREALLRQCDTEQLRGTVEADGAHFCGKPRSGRIRRRPKPEAVAAAVEARLQGKRPPRRGMSKRNYERRKNRRIVMVFREHSGQRHKGATKTRVSIAMSENSAVADFLSEQFVAPGATIMTDESGAYTNLSRRFEHLVVEHAIEYSTLDGVNENQAESYNSRLRRAEYGVFHGFRPKYLLDYASEFAWREDVRRKTAYEKLADLFGRISQNGLSQWWRGYWQGHHRAGEFCYVERDR